MKIREIETPAILLDRKIMEENSRKMEEIIRGTSMVLYPHYKSHKCLPIAQWQMAHGAGGITCAKLGEAEDLIEGHCESGRTAGKAPPSRAAGRPGRRNGLRGRRGEYPRPGGGLCGAEYEAVGADRTRGGHEPLRRRKL